MEFNSMRSYYLFERMEEKLEGKLEEKHEKLEKRLESIENVLKDIKLSTEYENIRLSK